MFHLVTLTVYVDDTGVESSGPAKLVRDAAVGATKHFTECLEGMGMEFSHTKNSCVASSSQLACDIARSLPNLHMGVSKRAKSLGGALGGGRLRNTQVLQQRLKQFRVRRVRFQHLRRAIGAQRTNTVLRTGGTAALVYGQANTGVSCSTLLAQRRAVAASAVTCGAGDLDMTLIMADGSLRGRADPAFAAHEEPISMWAEAVWCQWLPRLALLKIAQLAVEKLAGAASPWGRVKGPAAAFVASAQRIGWTISSALEATTDKGVALDFTRDSPAYIQTEVRKSVWRWRWRRLEERIPSLRAGDGGWGAHIQPIFRLLNMRPRDGWGPREQGALRSAVCNRQWPQSRLHQAGKVASPNCRLCVNSGICDANSSDWRHRGTLLHRIWLCPVLEEARRNMVPEWLLDEVKKAIRPDGSMAPDKLALYTRALMRSPEASVSPAPSEETFVWVKRPKDGMAEGKIYVDGSLLDGEWQLAGCCARRGWALAAVDCNGTVTAAAKGRPPAWCSGIHGAELWGLLMATQVAAPGVPFRVDCLAVQQGAQRGQQWAEAPDRVFARAWAPVAMVLEDHPGRVAWMPAHCGAGEVGVKRLSNGELLSVTDRESNELVDRLAKEAAEADRIPKAERSQIRAAGERLTAVAKWIGQVTVLASEVVDPDGQGGRRVRRFRDTEGDRKLRSGRARPVKRKASAEPEREARTPGVLAGCARWEALRQRVIAKERASKVQGAEPGV